MPYGEGHFDKVYAIEATCHAQSLLKIYSEVFRVLKPGGLFALYEWIMTDAYNPSDPYHKKLKADILVSRVHSRVILCLRRTCTYRKSTCDVLLLLLVVAVVGFTVQSMLTTCL